MKDQDYRLPGTAIGAVMGLLAVRGLLPKNNRTVQNYLYGTGVGAGAGYLGGSYVNAYKGPLKDLFSDAVSGGAARPIDDVRRSARDAVSSLAASPGGGITGEESKVVIPPQLRQEGYDTGYGKVDLDPISNMATADPQSIKKSDYLKRLNMVRADLAERVSNAMGNTKGAEEARDESRSNRERLKNLSGRTDEDTAPYSFIGNAVRHSIGDLADTVMPWKEGN